MARFSRHNEAIALLRGKKGLGFFFCMEDKKDSFFNPKQTGCGILLKLSGGNPIHKYRFFAISIKILILKNIKP